MIERMIFFLEVLLVYLVPMAIVADHQLAPRLQGVKELSEKFLLVGYM